MTNENRNSAIAAAIIMIGFGLFVWYLPALMMAAGDWSPWLAAVVMIVFLGALFFIFWLRGRSQRRKGR